MATTSGHYPKSIGRFFRRAWYRGLLRNYFEVVYGPAARRSWELQFAIEQTLKYHLDGENGLTALRQEYGTHAAVEYQAGLVDYVFSCEWDCGLDDWMTDPTLGGTDAPS